MPNPRKTIRKAPEKEREPDAIADISDVEARRLSDAMSVYVMDTLKHYWLSPADARSALSECFKIFAGIAKTCPQVSFRCVGGVLSVNGRPVENAGLSIRMMVEHFANIGIDNFTFADDVPLEEFGRFLDLVAQPGASFKGPDGLRGVLDQNNIRRVTCKKMIYREIADGEVMVSQDLVKGAGEGGDGTALAGGILAFLKGDVSLSDKTLSAAAREVASDPEKMAELILKAAVIQSETATVEGGETLGDFIVGCLRRTVEAIKEDPSIRTQKGKKKAIRDLVLLEEEIVKRMREMADAKIAETEIETVTDEIEEITEEIKIDAVADEYVDKTMASQEAEEKLLALMRAEGAAGKGIDEVLKRKLAERGITGSGWQDLMVRSGVGRGGSGGGGGGGGGGGSGMEIPHIIEAITHLNTLLDNMEKEFARTSKSGQEQNARQLIDVLTTVNGQIHELSAATGRKILALAENIQKDDPAVARAEGDLRSAGQDLTLTRRQVLEAVSDIVRDITEPLELIRTSVEMMRSKTFEGSPDMKDRVLHLMSDNADLAKVLLDNLRALSNGKPSPPAGT